MSGKVLVTGDIPRRYISKMEEAGFEVISPKQHLSEDRLRDVLSDIDGYLLGGDEVVTEGALRDAKQLKMISFWGTGYASFIDTEAASKKGILITNTPNANADSVAEFTVGHILNLRRQITKMNNDVKRGEATKPLQRSLEGASVGIVGLGSIGCKIASILSSAFSAQISYYNRSPIKFDVPGSWESTSLSGLLSQSEILIIMASTNETSVGMIDKDQFEIMRPDSILINTARADLVNPTALFQALSDKRIMAAAFDGYYIEPLPSIEDDPYGLLSLPDEQFIITPHAASATPQAIDRMSSMATNSLIGYLLGERPQNAVNQEKITRSVESYV